MRVPQVNERIKEAPAQALRGVFAGIGQLLLITDKLRNKTPFGQQAPYGRPPERSPAAAPRPAPTEPVTDQAPASAPSEPEAVAEPTVAETMATPTTPTAPKTPRSHRPPKTPWAPSPGAETRDFDKTGNVRLITSGDTHADDEPAPAAAAEPAAAPADPGPPLPNYDELSVASLRARLRNLDAAQVRGLVEYEKAHAGRAEVIVMFERRIAKLETGE